MIPKYTIDELVYDINGTCRKIESIRIDKIRIMYSSTDGASIEQDKLFNNFEDYIQYHTNNWKGKRGEKEETC